MAKKFVTFHFVNHGMAFFKHILSQFYTEEKLLEEIYFNNLNQNDLNTVFDKKQQKGFVFDEIIYIIPKNEEVIMRRTTIRNIDHYKSSINDEKIPESLKKEFEKIFKKIEEEKKQELPSFLQNIEEGYEYFSEISREIGNQFKESLWRNMQYYPVKEQIKWLQTYSNFKDIYPEEKLRIIEIDLKSLNDEKEITNIFNTEVIKDFEDDKDELIINISLGGGEIQVAWHTLAALNRLPQKTKFIKTYDDKTDTEKRLKKFSIKECPTRLLKEIELDVSDEKSSNEKFKAFINSGFATLIIGERGTGKSHIVRMASNKEDNKIVSVNCASFDDDSSAEIALFGKHNQIGAFGSANKGGILFFDEIHNLSKVVQSKLLLALQTNENNEMKIKPVGDKDPKFVKCTLVFASNKSIPELRKRLLPEFYDRIAQHIYEIPPLRERRKDIEKDWKKIWYQLKFQEKDCPREKKLFEWLRELPLHGNYRDLQKIAMYYNAFLNFNDEIKKDLKEKTAFEYAKNQFETYHMPLESEEEYNFSFDKTADQMIKEYQFELQKWAIENYGSRKKAAQKLSVQEKTLNNWKNNKEKSDL